jgi:glycosyltransferase involved in cell wall biosynthesis
MVTLLAPEPGHTRSGGHIYNHRIGMELSGRGFSLTYLPTPVPDPARLASYGVSRDSMILLDSLFFVQRDWLHSVSRLWKGKTALLVHYLPSIDPALSTTDSSRLRLLEAEALSRADKIVTSSHFMAATIKRLFPGTADAVVAHPGVDRSFRKKRKTGNNTGSGYKENKVRLLTVANWTDGKNHSFLLPVLYRLKELSWNWNIVGETEGNEKQTADFRRMAQSFGIEERINITGSLPPASIPAVLAEADLFLFPSRFESYGMALAEALCAGLPAVAGRVGGTEEVCKNREGALLLEADDTDSWTRTVGTLITDTAARKDLGAAAHRSSFDFPDWKESADRLYSGLEGL